MKEIDRDLAMNMILESHSDIEASWNKHLEFWEEEEPGITNDFSVYVKYVEDLVLSENIKELETAASLVEQFIEHGNYKFTFKDR